MVYWNRVSTKGINNKSHRECTIVLVHNRSLDYAVACYCGSPQIHKEFMYSCLGYCEHLLLLALGSTFQVLTSYALLVTCML